MQDRALRVAQDNAVPQGSDRAALDRTWPPHSALWQSRRGRLEERFAARGRQDFGGKRDGGTTRQNELNRHPGRNRGSRRDFYGRAHKTKAASPGVADRARRTRSRNPLAGRPSSAVVSNRAAASAA